MTTPPPISLSQLHQALEAEAFTEYCDYVIVNMQVAQMAARAGDRHGRRVALEKAMICMISVGRDEFVEAAR
jgi:hypothetical protein